MNTFFTKHSAIANSDSFLGACRYLLAEALTDANFHSYRDPVSKALGGKIITIMVDIDNLGGMSIPVGKKTIINLLDEHYSGLANAAGWSGVGIVEGMALFLDGFGYSQPAQKIVDAFELIWANESVMNEGNAFLAARAKAIEEDAEEFEFNGKTYPVIKENEEIEEVTEDEIEIKVDGDYEIEVEKEEDEEGGEEEAPAEEVEETEEIAEEVSEEESEEVEETEEVAEEESTNEAEVKSDEDFKEYAFSVLQQAFGDKFDEEKAQEVVDGLLGKHGDDYGAAVGALQSSLG